MPAPRMLTVDKNHCVRMPKDSVFQFTSPLSVSIDTGAVKIFQQNESGEWKELHQSEICGYYTVKPRTVGTKSKKSMVYVHRLVATVYCDNPNGNKYVDHKDGDRKNNNPKNLRWVTCRENQLYRCLSERNKMKEHNRGVKAFSLKRERRVRLYRANEELFFDTMVEAAKVVGTSSQNLHMCMKRGYRAGGVDGWKVEYVD